jgi:hypothetical protein
LTKILHCSICGRPIHEDAFGWTDGHNAQPVKEGRCCSLCNWEHVIPARLNRMFTIDKTKHKPEPEESDDE